MARNTSLRFGVVVFDADGDMGDGQILGPYRTQGKAWDKVDAITSDADRRGFNVTAFVVPMVGDAGVRATVNAVTNFDPTAH